MSNEATDLIDLDRMPGEHTKPYEVEIERGNEVEQHGYDTLAEAEEAYKAALVEPFDEIALHDLEAGCTLQSQRK